MTFWNSVKVRLVLSSSMPAINKQAPQSCLFEYAIWYDRRHCNYTIINQCPRPKCLNIRGKHTCALSSDLISFSQILHAWSQIGLVTWSSSQRDTKSGSLSLCLIKKHRWCVLWSDCSFFLAKSRKCHNWSVLLSIVVFIRQTSGFNHLLSVN